MSEENKPDQNSDEIKKAEEQPNQFSDGPTNHRKWRSLTDNQLDNPLGHLSGRQDEAEKQEEPKIRYKATTSKIELNYKKEEPNFYADFELIQKETGDVAPPPPSSVIPPPPKPPIPPNSEEPYQPDGPFDVSKEEFRELVEFRQNPETRNRVLIFLLGVFFTAFTLAGALIGYVRSYNRFFRYKRVKPRLYPLKPINRVAMAIGVAFVWAILIVIYFLIAYLIYHVLGFNSGAIVAYLVANLFFSGIVYGAFKAWQIGIENKLIEDNKFGSARFAREDELKPLRSGKGYYIGYGLHYSERGHCITTAGTRGGKGVNILIPNLLGACTIETSWVVIDPKGENAAITGRYQRESGKNVVILNPWDLLHEYVGDAKTYNPLDMLSDKSSPHLVDDVQMLAEMIVPVVTDAKDPFWSDTARTVVSGLLLHLVISQPDEERNLTTLWKWARLVGDDWDKLIQDMGISDDPVNGVVVQNAANEILKLSAAGEDTFGSIVSGVLQATDFLKSPLLQKALQSGFDPKTLADGNTTLYVIIPADKLRSHSRWLRLVVTSVMRAVIRKPKNRVTFLLDEFAALGYLPEIETALSTYAGYNVTVWPILQSLIQLKPLYGDNWQSFIANCNVRQYFSINDNESADYISAAIGQTSHTISSKAWFGTIKAEANERRLITPDELRRESGKKIFMFVGDLPPTYIPKMPYYLNSELNVRADKNPYIEK